MAAPPLATGAAGEHPWKACSFRSRSPQAGCWRFRPAPTPSSPRRRLALRATTSSFRSARLLLLAVALATGSLDALEARPGAVVAHPRAAGRAPSTSSPPSCFIRASARGRVGLIITGQMLASGCSTSAVCSASRRALPPAPAGGRRRAAGAALIVCGRGGAGRPAKRGMDSAGAAAGAVLPVQGAVNALLRADLGGAPSRWARCRSWSRPSRWPRCWPAARAGLRRRPQVEGVPAMPWWGWLGGFARCHLRDHGVHRDSGNRRRRRRRPDGGGPAGRFGVRSTSTAGSACRRRAVSGLRIAGVVLLLAGVALIKLA